MPRLATLARRLKPMIANRLQEQQVKQQQASKPSQQPGYRIRGREGQRLRSEWLRMHPLCGDRTGGPSAEHSECVRAKRITIATQVDHIEALAIGGQDTGDNRQSLCKPCHQAKSATEPRRDAGGAGRVL